jgi:chromosome segregation ATPase
LKELKAGFRQTKAELEETRAREEETSGSLGSELEDLRKRLASEQSARRNTEQESQDSHEEMEAELATMQARAAEIEKGLEERDQRILELQAQLEDAGDESARVVELEDRLAALSAERDAARAKVGSLEAELADQTDVGILQRELDQALGERDRLVEKLRDSEKVKADAAGALASLKSTNTSLQKKLEAALTKQRHDGESLQARIDALTEENRRMKEQLAGLNARVRTLTEY